MVPETMRLDMTEEMRQLERLIQRQERVSLIVGLGTGLLVSIGLVVLIVAL